MNKLNDKTLPRRDSRGVVLVLLVLLFIFLDCYIMVSWPSMPGDKESDIAQLYYKADDNMLVVKKSAGNWAEPFYNEVPVRYTPFFFQKIPINSADREMLETVRGIGPKLAHQIIDYRLRIGPFTSEADLCRLHGIGRERAAKFSTVFTFSRHRDRQSN